MYLEGLAERNGLSVQPEIDANLPRFHRDVETAILQWYRTLSPTFIAKPKILVGGRVFLLDLRTLAQE
jgi:hypothetical protein